MKEIWLVLFQRVGEQQMYILSFVQQQHAAQISDTFVSEARWSHQFQTLQLSKMCRVSETHNRPNYSIRSSTLIPLDGKGWRIKTYSIQILQGKKWKETDIIRARFYIPQAVNAWHWREKFEADTETAIFHWSKAVDSEFGIGFRTQPRIHACVPSVYIVWLESFCSSTMQ